MHTVITCNVEESHQKYRFATVSNRLMEAGEGGRLKLVLLDPILSSFAAAAVRSI